MSDESTTFRASLPAIMSAIRAGGDGGVRIQLDIPDSDMAEALRLLLWRDRVMVVTVRPDEPCFTAENNDLETGSKWKS